MFRTFGIAWTRVRREQNLIRWWMLQPVEALQIALRLRCKNGSPPKRRSNLFLKMLQDGLSLISSDNR